ncbi:MAG TPA: hypothetical protein VMV27_15215 [Candidatus Binataceae bacterium]|nr:hypothetical protein [Candidatus Binataceae bacterium]
MTSRKFIIPALAVLLVWAGYANAVSLSLQGQGAGLATASSEALYASDSSGKSVLVTEVGLPSPDGGDFSEVGVPSMMPDGRVLFGAETTAKDGKTHWAIFVGNPDLSPVYRVARAVDLKPTKDCAPEVKGDPYPVADADGDIAFMAQLAAKSDALVLYRNGTLNCIARSGGTTIQGNRIAVLSFGSPQMGDPGQVVFNAWLDSAPAKDGKANEIPRRAHRQALLIASREAGINELAVEGDYGPNHTRYEKPFGLPAALPSSQGTVVAFTSKTASGAALFLYRDGAMARVLPAGTLTQQGPVSYLSPGRPGLMSDGTTAVLAGCARVPVVFRLAHQRLDLRLQRGQLTPFGTELESLGDPVLTADGTMFIGATDSEDNEKLYELGGDGSFFEVGNQDFIYKISTANHRHSIFTGTLAVNQHGDFAYLGGK